MAKTTVRCYLSPTGQDLIRKWWELQDGTIRAAVATMLDYWCYPRERWAEGWSKPLEDRPESECEGLEELILDGRRDNGRRYYCRVIGFWGPAQSDFTMLYAFEKSSDPSYQAPCEEAQARKAAVQQDWNRADECDFSEAGTDQEANTPTP